MQTERWSLLDYIENAAVVVNGSEITYCNAAARRLGVTVSTPLEQLLPPEVTPQQLPQLQEVTLPALNGGALASVCRQEDACVLVLRTRQASFDAQLLAQVARVMREPLNEIANATAQLLPLLESWEDNQVQRQGARLSRSYYRLLRTVANLSQMDVLTGSGGTVCRERVELKGFFDRFCEHAQPLVEEAGHSLQIERQNQMF